MRLLAILAVVILACGITRADEALFDEKDVWQLYSRVEGKFSDLNGASAQLAGVAVGTVLNDRIGFALAAYTLLNSVAVEDSDFEALDTFDFWEGGALMDYTFAPGRLFHLNAGVLLGGGTMEGKSVATGKRENEDFALIEPGLNLLINLSKTIELGLGVSYRFVQGIDRAGLSDSDMSSVAGNVFIRMTEF